MNTQNLKKYLATHDGMDTPELKQFLRNTPDVRAGDLLAAASPTFRPRFRKACRDLKKLMDEIQVFFPDATYYTASGGLNIVLGDTHSGIGCTANHELSAEHADNGLAIGDGDW